ncbi:MAG: RNA methyltransferase [Treponema sp.]|nr:RNA methyltransferase [Treponema sp.]
MNLNDIKIVLSRVSESGNVGAICRAIKNMGLSELRLASPQPLITEEICKRAVNSADIWENARIYDNLADATADCSIVIGTTRRRGHNRKNISMTPFDLAKWLAKRPGPAAIVFGNERTGLEDEELELCNFASHIPVSEAQPSINLSHAVLIYAYEFFLAMEKQLPVKGEWAAMDQAKNNELADSVTNNLAGLGFYKKTNKDRQMRFFRDIFSRAGLSQSEGEYFNEIIAKACQLSSSVV